jgi:hypothetical protein
MTKAPFNLQLRRTQEKWISREKSCRRLEITNNNELDTLQPILTAIKLHMGTEDGILAKTQAYIRGNIERTQLLLSGAMGRGLRSKLKRTTCRVGMVLHGFEEDGITKVSLLCFPSLSPFLILRFLPVETS